MTMFTRCLCSPPGLASAPHTTLGEDCRARRYSDGLVTRLVFITSSATLARDESLARAIIAKF